METVRLYTRQDIRSLKELEEKGCFTNKIAYVKEYFGDISEYILGCYNFFVKEASKRVPKPDEIEMPVWCAISNKNCMPPIENTILYVLDVPKDEVIYFDGMKWDYVLNHHYIPLNEEDEKNYNERLKKKGIENGFEFFEGKYKNFYPDEKKIVMDSWTRIFDIDEWDIYKVQGNIWQIKKEWIVTTVRQGEIIP